MTQDRVRFAGKRVVVTGGNSGIGLAAAEAFVREGARVAIIGRNAQTLQAARERMGADCIAVQADMSRMEDVYRATATVREALGSVDVLFANAGTGTLVPVAAVTEALWDSIFNVNLKGLYFTVQQLLPLMGKGGSVVLCSSISAVRTMPGSSIYSATKAAVNALGRAFAVETMAAGIRVNVVMPGGVDTPILERAMPADAARIVKEQMASHTPMGRLGLPEEIAAAVLFLSAPEASYITGTELIVDGGVVGCAS